MNGEGMRDDASLSGTAACCVDYLAYHGPEEAELSLWTGFMQETASVLRRTTLPRTRMNRMVLRDRLGPKDARGYTRTRVKG